MSNLSRPNYDILQSKLDNLTMNNFNVSHDITLFGSIRPLFIRYILHWGYQQMNTIVRISMINQKSHKTQEFYVILGDVNSHI